MDPVSQTPGPQVTPQPVIQPRMNLALVGVIVLLLVLLGISFSQILSLKKQVEKLETAAEPEPTFVATPAPTSGTNEPIEITGIIQKADFEEGCWYIQPEIPECEGDKCPLNAMGMPANYESTNLPKELRKTGLTAKFKLEVQEDVVTTCQLGPVVKILDYQIIK